MKKPLVNLILIETIFFLIFALIMGLNSATQKNSARSEKGVAQDLVITYQFKELDLNSTGTTKCDKNSNVISTIPAINVVKVCIPFNKYTDKQFPVLIENVQNNDELKIKLIESRTFYVEKNSNLVYTHRYQEHVFYFEPTTLKKMQDQLGNRVYIEEKTRPYNGLLASFILFFLAISVLINSLLLVRIYGNSKSKQLTHKLPNYFYLVIGSMWAASFLAWYLGPRDSIGSLGRAPFGPSAPLFSDFFQIAQSANYGNPYLEGAVNYPALATFVLKGYGNFITNSLVLLILSLSLSMFILLYRQIAEFNSLNSLHFLLFSSASFPILYGIFRGNLDVLVSSLVIASFYFWGRSKKNIASIFLLSIAITLKLWPIFFLLILLKFKKYRETLWVGFITFFLTISTTIIYSRLNFERFLSIILSSGESKNSGDISEFSFSYSLRPIFGGLFHLIKFRGFDSSAERLDEVFAFLNSKAILLVLFILMILTLILLFRLKTFNAVYLYAASIPLLFFSPSYSYRAIPIVFYLYLLITNINSIGLHSINIASRISAWEWLSFALLLAPSTILFFPGTQISLNSIFQPIGLLTLMFFAFLRSNTNRLVIERKSSF